MIGILQKYETNKGSMKRMKICEYPDIEEKAEFFATKLGHKQFKASQGWLSNWKIRNNVVFRKICGENASVDQSICSDCIDAVIGEMSLQLPSALAADMPTEQTLKRTIQRLR
eukprot:XP_016659169.1 PREDICTED: uncharacterized protein LOC107883522 [Acyrthosiphon pisum]